MPRIVDEPAAPVARSCARQHQKLRGCSATFGDRVLVDTSLGTPELALTVGTASRRAAYVRGMGRHSKSPRRIAEDIWGAERVAAEWNSDSWMRSQIRRWKPKATALADGGRRDLVPRFLPEE